MVWGEAGGSDAGLSVLGIFLVDELEDGAAAAVEGGVLLATFFETVFGVCGAANDEFAFAASVGGPLASGG